MSFNKNRITAFIIFLLTMSIFIFAARMIAINELKAHVELNPNISQDDKVKIDKSLKDKFLFLENFDVMQGIISLSHGLNLKVVTEGVETLEEFNQLKIHKSDFVQGFYFSKPVEADKVIDLITKKYI